MDATGAPRNGPARAGTDTGKAVAVTPRQAFARKAMAILWASFLVAGVQEALVFVVVDPTTLHWFGSTPIEWSVQAIYTVTFLLLWCTTATAGALAMWLMNPDAL